MKSIETKPSTDQLKVFHSTLNKLKKSEEMKHKLIPYIQEHYPFLLFNPKRKQRICECGNEIVFRRYLETGNIQLVSANFCKHDRICLACATKRAMRMIKKFQTGIEEHDLYKKNWYYIVLTISHKAGDSLEDSLERLKLYKSRLAKAYRNSKRDMQKNKSIFSLFDGMIISIEISHKGKFGFHPHINILACTDKEIPIERIYKHGDTNPQILDEWKKMTDGTSYIHNIRKINVDSDKSFSRSGIGEVFKYAIKFSDLTMEELAEVMVAQYKHQYRFIATYGIFRGWKLAKWEPYKGDWSEGLYLYNEDKKDYDFMGKIESTKADIS